MKSLIHEYKGHEVRTRIIDGEIYFCAVDVGIVLEISDVQRQTKRYEKGVINCPTLTKGGTQNIIYINESNLYRLIFRSRKPEAKAFQDWVMEEVLPSIRKTGQYSVPKTLIEKSKKDRNYLTEMWNECGVEKRHQFIQLTLQEYKALGFEKGKRKSEFTKYAKLEVKKDGEEYLVRFRSLLKLMDIKLDPVKAAENINNQLLAMNDGQPLKKRFPVVLRLS